MDSPFEPFWFLSPLRILMRAGTQLHIGSRASEILLVLWSARGRRAGYRKCDVMSCTNTAQAHRHEDFCPLHLLTAI